MKKNNLKFVKALGYMRSVDDTLSYCLTRKLKTKVGKNVLWNVKHSRFLLRNAISLLKASEEEIKKLKDKAHLVEMLKKNLELIQHEEKIDMESDSMEQPRLKIIESTHIVDIATPNYDDIDCQCSEKQKEEYGQYKDKNGRLRCNNCEGRYE
jgi:hypothetical protein